MSDLFGVSGVSSGIPWDDLIGRMLERSKRPAAQWQRQIDTLEVQKTLYQEMQSNFNKLRNMLTPLRLANAYNAKTVEYTNFSSNESLKPENIVTAKVGAEAELTWWDIEVITLARAQRHISKRFDSVSDSLGISGKFDIRVGRQIATIEIDSGDNLRMINQKLYSAVDQNGAPLAVTAKLLDNRLVIESAQQGKNSSGEVAGLSFIMGGGNEYYLPHSLVRMSPDPEKPEEIGKYIYPPQILRLSYSETSVDGSQYIYDYIEKRDFEYDATTGKITWLERTPENPARRPPLGAEFTATFTEWRDRLTQPFKDPDDPPTTPADRTIPQPNPSEPHVRYDILPFLRTGGKYLDVPDRKLEILGTDGQDYKEGRDFDIIEVEDNLGKPQEVIAWRRPVYGEDYPQTPNDSLTYGIHIGFDHNYAFDENVFYFSEPVTWSNWEVLDRRITGEDTHLDYLPRSLEESASAGAKFEIVGLDGTIYTEGKDFKVREGKIGLAGENRWVIEWLTTSDKPQPATYEIRSALEGDYGENSILARLGFITPSSNPAWPNNWTFPKDGCVPAEDAVFKVDGVEVTRSSNTVDDLIAHVTLELKGEGKVRINIVRDLETTVENLNKFIEEYNTVMEWINFYVSQKEDGANPVDESDHLSSILQQSRGNTVFGVLHGDQLLWSIKNQLRMRLSNPISLVSSSLTSRKVQHTSDAMNIRSSFYLYVGGKATVVTVEPTDSMEDIRRKISSAENLLYDGRTQRGGPLGLSVTIRDGQLVIDGPRPSSSYTAGDRETVSETLIRGSGISDYLSFIPVTEQPVSGELMVYSGRNPFTEGQSTLYQEGIDYRVVTSETTRIETFEDGTFELGGVTETKYGTKTIVTSMSSSIEWIDGRGPRQNESFHVSYEYFSSAVAYSEIPGSGPSSAEIGRGVHDLSFLELRQDASKSTMSAYGITTESMNYGKSGLLEFDEEKFLEMMESDPNITANVMLTFMRDFDVYIGNLVDSSQILVAGEPVTKGRIAAALNRIDSEQQMLYERINKLERELATRQTALYKQYSDMEVAIQRLNAQMSSIANFVNSMGGGG